MNATLNFEAITSSDRPRWSLHQNNNNKTSHYYLSEAITHTTVKRGVADVRDNEMMEETTNTCSSTPIRTPANFFDEGCLLFDSEFSARSLHKSNSYSGSMRPKALTLKQKYLNGRIVASLTDDDIASTTLRNAFQTAPTSTIELESNTINNYDNDAVVELNDEHDLLMPNPTVAGRSADDNYRRSLAGNSPRRSIRGAVKARNRMCCSRKVVLGFLLLILAIAAFLLFAYLTRDYTKHFLLWIEAQNPWAIVAILLVCFVVVSFPIIVGYFVLMLTSGYLFGAIKGLLIVIVGANLGVAVCYWTLRSFRQYIPVHRVISNETARAILRVISGPKAFRVVLFTRLTPIPFGVQNLIFAISTINPSAYHTASLIGLLPAQIINAYLGSTLRSMQEVLNNHGTAVTGYISFGVEVICGVALMVWVIQKARKELTQTLLSDPNNEGKLIEIDV
ncbi:transmembrane protein 64 [Ceratitis capitata]|uniref:(Mediterranean fruit fly) hypothetical protein n=1 Tax=Ceratitis capitata TaxID=7213 RepID=W8BEU2_CERCA|nr:transmembrane protein 64 [Ceratitis capitata]XP_012155702.1 transmembrane protein 64 [Ceratitis capitata]XP_012155703.1 transmembrane protein 64 [Ceratitis capitata]XP_020713245.1 transmembrane protein 64 [Ceratitis capitata]XP_020713246.1 transmembrane protein 64 [Ceratitis capitata]CAD7005394.1 unnamed protein product [Ceratitis capitata]